MVMSKMEKTNYKRKFNEENYARIGLYVKPEVKDALETHKRETGESVNAFITRAISEQMERDKKMSVE